MTVGRAVTFSGLTPPVGGSGNVYPNIADQLEYLPRTNLVAAFVAARVSLLTKDGGGVVSAWQGLLGAVASNGSGKRPTWAANAIAGLYPGVAGDGTDDVLLTTSVLMPASGYLVTSFQQPASPGATVAHCGASTDSSNRSYLGHRTSGSDILAAGTIGSLTMNSFSGTTPLISGNRYVTGMKWHGGNAKLRLNGVQEATGTYTGGAAVAKNLALHAYANGAAGSSYSKAILAIVALYSGNDAAIDSAFMASVDTALGAGIGLTI